MREKTHLLRSGTMLCCMYAVEDERLRRLRRLAAEAELAWSVRVVSKLDVPGK